MSPALDSPPRNGHDSALAVSSRPTPPPVPKFDPATASAFLNFILSPEEGVFEIRLLEKTTENRGYLVPRENYSYPRSGWYDNVNDAVCDLGKIRGVSAYVTVNPVHKDLFAKSANKLAKSKGATGDSDITVFRLLYLDFDSDRRPNISATDNELAVAVARRDKFLTDHPALARSSIWGKSGNGAWILVLLVGYPPSEGRKLASRALAWISKTYGGNGVKIDKSVENEAQLGPVPGTVKCKGSHVPDRPHRLATLDSPDRDPRDIPRFNLVEWLNEVGAEETPTATDVTPPKPHRPVRHPDGGISPADDFDRQNTWEEILVRDGWSKDQVRRDGEVYWTRPGKGDGTSASTGYNGKDILVVWTNNAAPLVPNEHYTKFQYYAQMNHGSDMSAAAKDLCRQGYGTWIDDGGEEHRNPPPPDWRLSSRTARKATELREAPNNADNGHADPQWPPTPPGKWVMCVDRDPANYGQIVEDLNAKARIHFISPSGHENTITLSKQHLREKDGSPLGHEPAAGDSESELTALSNEDLGIKLASQIEAKPIVWLWPYRLAAGEMALLAGDGGLGKSSLLLAIAAKISRGGEWWDGTPVPIGDTIIVSAEDDPETTIVPRLKALDADLDRIAIVAAKVIIRKAGKDPEIHPQSLQNRPYWKEILRRRPDARILVVDPLPSYLGGGVSDAKNNELRGVLEPFLDDVTRPAGVCLLANTHLNKSIDAKTPTHRITGSIAYVNLPRNVHVVVSDPQNPERRFIKQCKCNNAPGDLSALAFRMEKQTVESKLGEIETAIPRFEEQTVSVDLAAVMSGSGDRRRGPRPIKSEKLAIWLFDYLSQERHPIQAGPLYDHAAAAFAGEVPNPLGEKDDNGRWTQGKALLRAADHIPNLTAPRDGKRVERYRDPDTQRWFWNLVDAASAF